MRASRDLAFKRNIMSTIHSVELEIAGRKMIIETGRMALQAAGAVTVTYGQTCVFSAVTTSSPRAGIDFFPLQVEYREKFYAAGRMPGGYFKRESRPTEREVLISRATDRPIRPLFPENFRNEVQINSSLLCADGQNEADVVAINAASAALVLSEIPFLGPVGAVRIGRLEGRLVVNPTHEEIERSDLDLIYVGTRDLPIMIEGSGNEVPEAIVLEAMQMAQVEARRICDAQIELRRRVGKGDKTIVESPLVAAPLRDEARSIVGKTLEEALTISGKQERQARLDECRKNLQERLAVSHPDLTETDFKTIFDAIEIETVRRLALEKGFRIGGRGQHELRHLFVEVGILPRTHGSALFSRGETQALAVVTLGTHQDAQEMDAIGGGPEEKRFLLHYNFPPFSVGEVGRLGGVGRREIGHGALAERCIRPVMPPDYPYTVRVVSEIMGSNGSSSMASVCAGALALMDAGVPIRKPVAGISIGLFTAPGQSWLVTDIIGAEDHCGDMDFKVAGTRDGITGFQVDLKIRGLEWDLVAGAFEAARAARLQILDAMTAVIPAPRPDLSPYAPRIRVLKIPVDKIGALIGPGGKNVRRITDTYKVEIDIEDDGSVHIFSVDGASMEAAVREVEMLTAEAEVGKIYQGKVTGLKDFGVFVEIIPGIEGLVHISELANFRVRSVEDICKVGDPMWVKCIHVDESGKIRLSRRAALEERGEAAQDRPPESYANEPEQRPRREERRENRGDGGREGRRHGGGRRH